MEGNYLSFKDRGPDLCNGKTEKGWGAHKPGHHHYHKREDKIHFIIKESYADSGD